MTNYSIAQNLVTQLVVLLKIFLALSSAKAAFLEST